MRRLLVALVAVALATACARKVKAPNAQIAPVGTVAVGEPVQLDGSKSNDPNSPPLAIAYQWSFTKTPKGSAARFNDATEVTPSFTPDVVGTYEVSLAVNNGFFVGRASADITAGPCGTNGPSIASITAAPASPHAGSTVQLTAKVSDADAVAPCSLTRTIASYAWRLVSAPAGSAARLNDATSESPSFVTDLPGDYVVELTVTDSGGLKATSRQTVTAGACGSNGPSNVAVTASPAQPFVGAPVLLDATFNDADSDCKTLSYTWRWSMVSRPSGSTASVSGAGLQPCSSLPDSCAAGGNDGPHFVPDVAGTYVVAGEVTDSLGHAASGTVVVQVKESTVTVSVTAPASAAVGESIALSASATDDASDSSGSFAFAWSVVSAPAGSAAAVLGADRAAASFVPDVAGSYILAARATNPLGASGSGQATIDVAACGHAAPVATAMATPDAVDVGNAVALTGTAYDPDDLPGCGLTQTLTDAWSLDVVPTGSTLATGAIGTALSTTLTPDVAGDYLVEFAATDSTGLASKPALVWIHAATCGLGAPSVAPAASANARVGTTTTLSANVTDPDADCGGPLGFTYAWSLASAPAGSSATLSSATAANPTFVPDVTGNYTFAVVATDSNGHASAPGGVSFNAAPAVVPPPFCAPTANLTAPTSGVTSGSWVDLFASAAPGSGSDCTPGPSTFTYDWTFTALPAGSGATLTRLDGTQSSFFADEAGTYSVQVVAIDSAGNSATKTVDVTVTAPPPICAPTVQITPSTPTVVAGKTLDLFATAAAGTGANCTSGPSTFSYAWSFSALPTGSAATLSPASGPQTSFTPDIVSINGYQVTVVATDTAGNVATKTVDVTVTAPLPLCAPTVTINPPSATVVAGQTLDLFATAAAGTGANCASGPSTFSYAWWFSALPAGSAARLSSRNGPQTSFSPDIVGTGYQVTVLATDTAGNVATKTVDVTATSTCGTAKPMLSLFSSPNQMDVGDPTFPNGFTLAAVANDPNTWPPCTQPETFSYQWAFDTTPSGSTTTITGATAAQASFQPDVAGIYQLRCTVTDTTGESTTSHLAVLADTCGDATPVANIAMLEPFAGASSPAKVGVDTTVQLDGSGSTDLDITQGCATTTQLSYRWTMTALPPGSRAQLNDASAIDPSFKTDEFGTYEVSLVVTGPNGKASTPVVFDINAQQVGTIVDRAAGMYSQTVLDPSGDPRIAYLDSSDDVRLAQCTANCGTSTPKWEFHTVATATGIQANGQPIVHGFEARPIGLANGPNGEAVVSYVTVDNNQCGHVYVRIGTATGTFPTPALDLFDQTTNCGGNQIAGYWNAVARAPSAGGGALTVAYRDSESSGVGVLTKNEDVVRYAVCTSMQAAFATNCGGSLSNWAFATIYPGGSSNTNTMGSGAGAFVSLDDESSETSSPVFAPRVAYYVPTGATGGLQGLWLATCTNHCVPSGWGTTAPTWTQTLVDGGNGADDVGRYASLRLSQPSISGTTTFEGAAIAYYDASGNGTLRYSRCTPTSGDPNCTQAASWIFTTVDNGNDDLGRFSSLALTYDATLGVLGHISYYDHTRGELLYADQSSGNWVLNLIDNGGGGNDDVGRFDSLALSASGNPRISYYDRTADQLLYFASGQ